MSGQVSFNSPLRHPEVLKHASASAACPDDELRVTDTSQPHATTIP